ncbi:hypothetical protein GW17_00019438 [Ensete ventricosum]|nr:hypothetical protein GW17_00019438 [Ensete ventricosum]
MSTNGVRARVQTASSPVPLTDRGLPAAPDDHVVQARFGVSPPLSSSFVSLCSSLSLRRWILIFRVDSGGKLKPLKQPKADKKEYDEVCIRTYALGFQMNSSKSVKGLFWRWRQFRGANRAELRLVLLERREREQPGLPLPARLAILLLPLVQNLLARDGCPQQKPLQQQQRPRLLPGESGSDLLLAGAPFTHLCFLPYSGHPTGWCGGWLWGRWVLLPATYQDEVSGSRFGLS